MQSVYCDTQSHLRCTCPGYRKKYKSLYLPHGPPPDLWRDYKSALRNRRSLSASADVAITLSLSLSHTPYFASLNREQINQSLTSSAVVDDVTVTVRFGVLWIRMCSPRWDVVSNCEICENTSTPGPFKISFFIILYPMIPDYSPSNSRSYSLSLGRGLSPDFKFRPYCFKDAWWLF